MSVRRHLSTRERVRLFALHGGLCHLCGGRIDGVREAWEISHEVPLALGGAEEDENTEPAHRTCHRAWTARVEAPGDLPGVLTAAGAPGTTRRAPARVAIRVGP